MKDWLTDRSWITRQSWPKHGRSFWSAGRQTRHPQMIVLHDTETVGFPGYNGGAAAPHFTVDLVTGATRQHIPLSHGARALTLEGTRLANVAGVIQIEIIGAVDPTYPRRYGHYDLPNRFPKDKRAQHHLARLIAEIIKETGIPAEEHVDWIKYPASYGRRGRQRLTVNQYLNYRGILGHQHVPGNDHGDPGALPVGSIVLPQVRALLGQKTAPSWETPQHMRAVQRLLNDVTNAGLVVDGVRGPKTEAATKHYQTEYRDDLTVDGSPGPKTRKALEEDMSEIKALRNEVRALTQEVKRKPTAKQIVQEWMTHRLYGFAAHYWLRRGSLGANTDHHHWPADPGSPADLELRTAEAILGEPVEPYTGTPDEKD